MRSSTPEPASRRPSRHTKRSKLSTLRNGVRGAEASLPRTYGSFVPPPSLEQLSRLARHVKRSPSASPNELPEPRCRERFPNVLERAREARLPRRPCTHRTHARRIAGRNVGTRFATDRTETFGCYAVCP